MLRKGTSQLNLTLTHFFSTVSIIDAVGIFVSDFTSVHGWFTGIVGPDVGNHWHLGQTMLSEGLLTVGVVSLDEEHILLVVSVVNTLRENKTIRRKTRS